MDHGTSRIFLDRQLVMKDMMLIFVCFGVMSEPVKTGRSRLPRVARV